MKNILHQGIVLHLKAQGKQHRCRCMGKGAIVSRETMAPFPASPHAVGIKKQLLCLAVLLPRPRAQKRDASFEASLLISSFYETEIT